VTTSREVAPLSPIGALALGDATHLFLTDAANNTMRVVDLKISTCTVETSNATTAAKIDGYLWHRDVA
jgi:hypothetical protein